MHVQVKISKLLENMFFKNEKVLKVHLFSIKPKTCTHATSTSLMYFDILYLYLKMTHVKISHQNFVIGFKSLYVATPLWPSVRMKLTLPELGTWSPPGLSKTQSLIVGVKTPCIGVFLDIIRKVSKFRYPK
jgi:hypothetical protein